MQRRVVYITLYDVPVLIGVLSGRHVCPIWGLRPPWRDGLDAELFNCTFPEQRSGCPPRPRGRVDGGFDLAEYTRYAALLRRRVRGGGGGGSRAAGIGVVRPAVRLLAPVYILESPTYFVEHLLPLFYAVPGWLLLLSDGARSSSNARMLHEEFGVPWSVMLEVDPDMFDLFQCNRTATSTSFYSVFFVARRSCAAPAIAVGTQRSIYIQLPDSPC